MRERKLEKSAIVPGLILGIQIIKLFWLFVRILLFGKLFGENNSAHCLIQADSSFLFQWGNPKNIQRKICRWSILALISHIVHFSVDTLIGNIQSHKAIWPNYGHLTRYPYGYKKSIWVSTDRLSKMLQSGQEIKWKGPFCENDEK